MALTMVILFAMLVEAVVTNIKWVVITAEDGRQALCWERVLAILIAVVLCLVFAIDVFQLVGFKTAVPYAPQIATGILIARGANLVNDLFGKLQR